MRDPAVPARRPPPLGSVASLAAFAAVTAVDWATGARINLSILFGVALLGHAWSRRPALLWAQVGLSLAATFLVYALDPPDATLAAANPHVLLNRTFAAGSVAVVGALLHVLIARWADLDAARERSERHAEALEASNRELAGREEEIARQNEELQSQTEELERQGEELRVANEELMRRERALETLLALSRSLATEITREQTMSKVCDALAQLVDGPSSAAAILEHEGDRVTVRCHTGFGAGGLAEGHIPLDKSLAALVLSRGRTAYIEDLSLRPDLRVPQPKDGPPMVSVLAAPLRVSGWPVGALELYGTRPTAWNEEQVALAESLAAQASVSLEAAALFEKVEAERRRLQTVLDNLPVGVLIAEDATGEKVSGNAAMAALYGAPSDANFSPLAQHPGGRGRTFRRAGRDLSPHELPLMRALRTGRPASSEEVDIVLGDGRTHDVMINAAPFFDRAGKVTGGVGVVVDIGPQKALQRELDVRRREAEEASVRKTRFLAAVSHDIRTPANAISLLAELIRRTAANPALVAEVPELASEMHESAMSLVNLLGDVLDVARFDSGKIEIQESDVSLGELLGEEYRRMQPLAREKGLSIDFRPPPEPLVVRADRIKLSRVFGNLLGNAIKFTEAGSVRLEACGRGDGWADVRVIDTGVGIAPEHQRHIFDEFFQLGNPERDRNKGTGLGLAICKRLVDAMGGRIAVDSAPGRGSTFTVSLPPAGTAALVPGAK